MTVGRYINNSTVINRVRVQSCKQLMDPSLCGNDSVDVKGIVSQHYAHQHILTKLSDRDLDMVPE